MNNVDRRVIELYVDTLANETNFNELLKNLLEYDNIITQNLKNKYKEMKKKGATNTSLNRELYKDIQTRGKDAFDFLVKCLKKTQPHLAELLMPLTAMNNNNNRRVIELNIDKLANETNFNKLLNNLSKNDIISQNLKEKYKEMKKKGATNTSLNRELYKDIQTRGKDAFDILVKCLKETQPHVAELLITNERTSSPTSDEGNRNENHTELPEFEGICTVHSRRAHARHIIHSVRNLCHPIKAKFVTDDKDLAQANFHLAIKADGMFQEEDLRNIEGLYKDPQNLKIIIINIIPGILDNAGGSQSATEPKRNSAAVFIVNIHIHKGDNVSSVIDIIKEVVANNAGSEIRDIFRMVMAKLTKWCCQLNTESRSFPIFRF